MNKKAFYLLGLLLILGCKSASAINREFENLNILKGVSQEQAITIAQEYALNSGRRSINISSAVKEETDSRHPVYLRFLTKYGTNRAWVIRFWPKIGSISFFRGLFLDYRYYVVVDKVTGQVLERNYGIVNPL